MSQLRHMLQQGAHLGGVAHAVPRLSGCLHADPDRQPMGRGLGKSQFVGEVVACEEEVVATGMRLQTVQRFELGEGASGQQVENHPAAQQARSWLQSAQQVLQQSTSLLGLNTMAVMHRQR